MKIKLVCISKDQLALIIVGYICFLMSAVTTPLALKSNDI